MQVTKRLGYVRISKRTESGLGLQDQIDRLVADGAAK